MKKIVTLFLVLAFCFSSCEKDDICEASTPTTPRLIITFHDISNPSILKNVMNLKVVGHGAVEGVVFDPTAKIEKDKYLANGSKIAIPLKTFENSTGFSFTLNSGNPNLENLDNIKIDYTRNEVFVSRACGFKTLFILNSTNPPITHTDAAIPDGKWIKYISVEKNNIDNENETHLKIFF
jgi:hypothetical protein